MIQPWTPCEARAPGCTGRAQHRHHKKTKARGGSDSPANIAMVCFSCHRRIHDHVAWSTDRGWLIPSWEEEPA